MWKSDRDLAELRLSKVIFCVVGGCTHKKYHSIVIEKEESLEWFLVEWVEIRNDIEDPPHIYPFILIHK